MSKTTEISRQILALVATGKPVDEAINEVLGAGSYEALASDLYDALRVKAA
jgi:hypothetical protein